MLENISYYTIFGRPLILYLGIITICSFALTAAIGYTNLHGKPIAEFKWHPRMAAISLTLAIIHGTLGILHYF